MHDCRKMEERLMELVFDELSEDRRIRTLAEVEACQHCHAEYQAMTQTLITFDEVSAAMMPDDDYWSGYEARLRRKLAADARSSWWQRRTNGIRSFAWKPVWAFAALLIVALLLWVLLRRPVEPIAPQQITNEKPATIKPGEDEKEKVAQDTKDDPKRNKAPQPQKEKIGAEPGGLMTVGTTRKPEREKAPMTANVETDAAIASVVDEETLRHFEKSQLLLRAFRNADDSDAVKEIIAEKPRWRELLFTNVLLRRDAEAKGNLAVEQVLNDLEPLLIELANLADEATTDDIRAVRERLQKREIIATLQLYAARPMVARAVTD